MTPFEIEVTTLIANDFTLEINSGDCITLKITKDNYAISIGDIHHPVGMNYIGQKLRDMRVLWTLEQQSNIND